MVVIKYFARLVLSSALAPPPKTAPHSQLAAEMLTSAETLSSFPARHNSGPLPAPSLYVSTAHAAHASATSGSA